MKAVILQCHRRLH